MSRGEGIPGSGLFTFLNPVSEVASGFGGGNGGYNLIGSWRAKSGAKLFWTDEIHELLCKLSLLEKSGQF